MAAPVLAKTIGVKLGTTANEGEYVTVRNLTRGGKLTGAIKGDDRSIVFNPAPSLAWQDGDLIQAEASGRLVGVKQKTIQSGGINFSTQDMNVSANTDTPGVSL